MGNCFDSYSSRKFETNKDDSYLINSNLFNFSRKIKKKQKLIVQEKETKIVEKFKRLAKELNKMDNRRLTKIIQNHFLFYNLTVVDMFFNKRKFNTKNVLLWGRT